MRRLAILALAAALTACGGNSCPFVLFGAASPTVGGQLRAPISPTDPREVPAANGDVALADAQGLPLPGVHAQSAKDGSYALPNVEPGYAYRVVARVKAPDGTAQKLTGLAMPTSNGDTANVNEATTVLTTGLTDGLTGMLGPYDDPTYEKAVGLVYQHIQADGLPDLKDKAAVLAKLNAWKGADAPLKDAFDALRAQLSKNAPSTNEVLGKLATREHQPTPGPIATGTPTPTPVDTAAVPSPSPSPTFQPGYREGAIADARFNGPSGLAGDGKGHLYLADAGNDRVRMIDLTDPTQPTVSTIAGTGQPGNQNGAGRDAQFNGPCALAFDPARQVLYVAESVTNRIRAIDLQASDHQVTTIAGGSGGSKDGVGEAAQFDQPVALAYDPTTQLLFVLEEAGVRIRAIETANGQNVKLFAGGHSGRGGDGTPLGAHFDQPQGLAVVPGKALYVADTANNVIVRVDLDASGNALHVQTAAGNTFATTGNSNAGNDDGGALSARFNGPTGLALGADGNLWIADTGNKLVRKFDLNAQQVSTVAGPKLTTLAGQPATLVMPRALAFENGAGYLADRNLGQLFQLP